VIHNHLSKAWVAGNIVYGNTSSYFLPLQIREAKPFCIRHSDVQFGIEGEGDFDADPLFTGAGPHPFRLSAGSPCRNAGPTDTTGFRLLPVDLAAVLRSMEGRIDVGAYESGDPAGVGEQTGGEPPGSGPAVPPRGGVQGAMVELTGSPNPFSGSVTLRLRMERGACVRLTVHDAAGRRVGSLLDGELPAGDRVVSWDGRDAAGRPLAPGVYFVRAWADGRTAAALRLVLGP
jgi:hypothetical protein